MWRDHPAVAGLPVGSTVSAPAAVAAEPGWNRGLIRTGVGCVSIVYFIGHRWALWNHEDHTLGDLAAKTDGVRVAPDPNPQGWPSTAR